MTEHDVEALAEQATENFDLMDYISGRTTVPTDSTVVYLDYETAFEIHRLAVEYEESQKIGAPKSIADEGQGDESILEKIAQLQDRVKDSGLTIHMRALNEPERDVIRKRVNREHAIKKSMTEDEKAAVSERRNDRVALEWIAAAATKIETPDGKTVSRVETGHIEALRNSLYDSEWAKVEALFDALSFARGLADSAIDAGFPGGETTSA